MTWFQVCLNRAMFHPLPLFVGLRYVRARSHKFFVSFITWVSLAGVCVGVAERLIADSLAYAMERHQFGQPIAEFQLVQAMLADMKAESFAARCMVEETARRLNLLSGS